MNNSNNNNNDDDGEAIVTDELDSQLENDKEFNRMREKMETLLDGLPVVDIAQTLNSIKKSKRKRKKKSKPSATATAGGGDDDDEEGADGDEEKTVFNEVIGDYETIGETEHLYTVEGSLENLIKQQAQEERLAIEAARRNLSTLLPPPFSSSATSGLSADKALAALRIDNMVTVTSVSQRIDCTFIAARGSPVGFGFNKKRFAAAVNRHRIANHNSDGEVIGTTVATTMTFPTGKIITTGAKKFEVAVQATEKTCEFISKMRADDDSFPYANLRATKIRIKNVVASTSLFFRIDIRKLQEKNPAFVRYETDEWIGAIMQLNCMSKKYAKRFVTVLVFEPGSLVFTGTNGYADCVEIFVDVFAFLRDCAIIDASAAVKSIENHSVGAGLQVATTGVSTVALSAREQSQNRNASVAATARNMLALDSMEQYERRKSEEAETSKRKKDLLADLRSNSKNLTSSSKRTELRTQPMPQSEALGLAHEMQQ